MLAEAQSQIFALFRNKEKMFNFVSIMYDINYTYYVYFRGNYYSFKKSKKSDLFDLNQIFFDLN